MSYFDSLPLIDRDSLLNQDAPDTLIITVSNRSAIRLRQVYIDHLKRSQDAKSFRLPQILPWRAFFDMLWREASFLTEKYEPRPRLDGFAEQIQWQQVLDNSDLNSLNKPALAQRMCEAHMLQYEWDVDVQPHEVNPEYKTFTNMLQAYGARLEEIKVWDEVSVMKILLDILTDQSVLDVLNLESNIFLHGFHEISVYQEKLLQTLADSGRRIARCGVERPRAEQANSCSFKSPAEELRSAILWARQRLSADPETRIAIVDPDLAGHAVQIDRYAHQILAREQEGQRFKWNLFLARPLSDWPLIRSLLGWLDVLALLQARRPVSYRQFGETVMHSIQGLLATEASQAARLDKDLRNRDTVNVQGKKLQLNTDLPADDVISVIKAYLPEFAEGFEKVLARLAGTSRERLSLSDWYDVLCNIIELLNFPGPQNLSSEQYLSCTVFEEQLKEVAALSEMTPAMSFSEAVSILTHKCRNKSFKPAGDPGARLDILRVLDAEGGSWDEIWMLGLQQDTLPATPRPNPFLPAVSLKRANAPRSTYLRELQWSEQMIKGILHSARKVLFTWHEFEGEAQTPPSSLIAPFEPVPVNIEQPVIRQAALTSFVDDRGPGIKGMIPRGYAFLEHQARCPLWAFGKYRLGLESLPDYPEYPLDVRVTGTVVHQTLEALWREIKDPERMQGLLETEDNDFIKEKVLDFMLWHGAPLRSMYTQLTVDYLVSCVRGLLMQEMKREDFIVLTMEKPREVFLGDIQLKLRVDRIDLLGGHDRLLIDIKTGRLPAFTDMLRERPVSLQLPLYAAFDDDVSAMAGVAYATTSIKEPGYRCLTREDLLEKKTVKGLQQLPSEDWKKLLETWKKACIDIAGEISSGYAAVKFEKLSDLDYCDIRPFLRLNDIDLESEQEHD